MRRLFSNIEFLVSTSSLIVLVSVFAAAYSNQWHWLARSGSILTIAGLLLTFRPLVRMGLAELLRSQSETDLGGLVDTAEDIEKKRQLKMDGTASKWGVGMAIAGTIVWAYGDLVGGLPC
ncbi:hypothetical protein [Pseudomonas gingeri]|uniref:Uncharacterized protein n=1 Tax=Pseudomonas gingeri TaxID=117681 RepID=A0A7Y7YJR4_9PSED|nr:hypothetical protein [Pseudomonas gingeri]NVZ78201.1 hypothetical protein [Pseudomonas gingeri]NWB32029.1 hypothetical protein [Pseudomonas gingeri]NWC37405.1 hypothetical protein [Pseudomonas gingeri]